MDELKNEGGQENFEEMLAQHEAQSAKPRTGEKISGKIIAISGDDVFVDVGLKEDGVMDHKEILDAEGNETAAVGDMVEAFVVGISSQGVKLSRSMSGSGVAALEEARDAAIPVEGRVKGACKGGYQVEIMGKTAFCPGSQMEIASQDEDLAGKQMMFLITKIENHGRNIVVSRRALIERERKENLDKLLAGLKIGDIVEGSVTRLAPFGVFVELAPHVEGMIHLSELEWSRVENAADVVSPGDTVQVKLIALNNDDKGRLRIALSRKQALGDPWSEVGRKFKVGDIVRGKVRRFAPFGAFVEIAPGIEGLVHLSEMAWGKRVNKPEEVLAIGDMAEVKIKDINEDAKRIGLSLKEALGDPWTHAAEMFKPGATVTGTVESKGQYGIFVRLAPGITGLLPQSAIRNDPDSAKYSRLATGDEITLVIQKADYDARRISLMPESAAKKEPEEEPVSVPRARAEESAESPGLGIMAQALNDAIRKKNKGD